MADSEETSAPTPPPPATLGELLRTTRLNQDLTIEQLSTELRIEAKQLAALEEDRFERIGVPVFVKGYLKQYGLRLGLNVNDLLALYTKQTTLGGIERLLGSGPDLDLRGDRGQHGSDVVTGNGSRAGSHQNQPFHDVTQFAHVAGPRVCAERRCRLGRQRSRRTALSAQTLEKMLG